MCFCCLGKLIYGALSNVMCNLPVGVVKNNDYLLILYSIAYMASLPGPLSAFSFTGGRRITRRGVIAQKAPGRFPGYNTPLVARKFSASLAHLAWLVGHPRPTTG